MYDPMAREVLKELAIEFGKLGLRKLIPRLSEPKDVTPEPRFSGKNIAIVVSITRPIKSTVKEFLYKEEILAEIIEIEGKERLSVKEDEWTEVVVEFYKIVLEIQKVLGAPSYHLFVSAPSALTFAFGTVLGLNYDVHVYHWFEDLNTYKRVLVTSKKLLG